MNRLYSYYKFKDGWQFSIKPLKLLTINKGDFHHGHWIRICGLGLSFKTKPLFSQRYGYTKYIKLGKWIISTI